MAIVTSNGTQLCYETFGDPADEPVLLIMGLGMQMTGWDEGFCKLLARRGYFVVRFDNRDSGLSTKVEGGSTYSLDDLAADAVGLLDALGVQRAHVVGASMGGMIAQIVALDYPDRVLSMTSMMANTGDGVSGQPKPEAIAALMSAPVSQTKDATIDAIVKVWRVIGSPEFPVTDRQLRAFVERDYERSYSPDGGARQLAAIVAAPDRTARLAGLHTPVLVVHGSQDPLVDVSGAEATAKAIPGAKLLIIDGMGHDIPHVKWPEIVDAIVANAKEAGHA